LRSQEGLCELTSDANVDRNSQANKIRDFSNFEK